MTKTKKSVALRFTRQCRCGTWGCRHRIKPLRSKPRFWVCPTCYIRFLRNGNLGYKNSALRSEADLDRASNMRIVEEMPWREVADAFGIHMTTAIRRVKAYWKR